MLTVLRRAAALCSCALAACTSAASVAEAPTLDCGFSPCAGNLVGRWQVTAGCVEGLAPIQDCPAASLRVAPLASGSLSFAKDGGYAFDWSLQGEIRVDVPIACTGNAACSDVGASIAAVCLDSGAGCSCSSSLQAEHVVSSGSYSSVDSTFTTTAEDGAGQSLDYCVSGDTLKFAVHESNRVLTVISARRVQ